MLLINQVVPCGCPRGSQGRAPSFPMGTGGGDCLSLPPSAEIFLKEVINQHMTAESKRSLHS